MSIYFQIDRGVVIGQHLDRYEQMGMLIQGKIQRRIGTNQTILSGPALSPVFHPMSCIK